MMRADEMRSGGLDRWIGRFPVRGALTIFFGFAVLGALATLMSNNDPGSLLGNLIVVGAVVAALGIRRQRLYLLIPLPALTYLGLAILTGAIHDASVDTSTTQLGLNFLQWIGNGFFSMSAATILVLLIFGARLLASRQLVSGSFPMSEQRAAAGQSGRAAASARTDSADDAPAGAPADSRYRKSRAPWDEADPWYDNVPRDREAWKSRNGRADRASRDDRSSRESRASGAERDRRDPRYRRPARDPWEGWDDAERSQRDGRDGREDRDGTSSRNGARDSGRDGRRGGGDWGGAESRQARQPERQPGDRRGDPRNGGARRGDDRNGDERRRPDSRNVPPGRDESATRVMPPARGPRSGAVPRSDAPGSGVPRNASGPRSGATRRGDYRDGDPRARDPRGPRDDQDPRYR